MTTPGINIEHIRTKIQLIIRHKILFSFYKSDFTNKRKRKSKREENLRTGFHYKLFQNVWRPGGRLEVFKPGSHITMSGGASTEARLYQH